MEGFGEEKKLTKIEILSIWPFKSKMVIHAIFFTRWSITNIHNYTYFIKLMEQNHHPKYLVFKYLKHYYCLTFFLMWLHLLDLCTTQSCHIPLMTVFGLEVMHLRCFALISYYFWIEEVLHYHNLSSISREFFTNIPLFLHILLVYPI